MITEDQILAMSSFIGGDLGQLVAQWEAEQLKDIQQIVNFRCDTVDQCVATNFERGRWAERSESTLHQVFVWMKQQRKQQLANEAKRAVETEKKG